MSINIGFDADGVLYDTEMFQLSEKVISFMKKEYGLDVVDINGYGIKDVFGCNKEIELDFWTKFVIYYSLVYKPRTWVKENFEALRKSGDKIFIITSKAKALEKNWKGIAVRILFELGLKLNGINVDGIEYCELDNPEESKLKAINKLNIHVMIEDKYENLNYLSNYVPVICVNTNNNRGMVNDNIVCVNDFDEIYVEIDKIKAKILNYESLYNLPLLGLKEKVQLSNKDREEYYNYLIKYYKSLPFCKDSIEIREKLIQIIASLSSLIFNSIYSPIIIGRENIPDTKGNIFVSNHLCSKDALFILCALKKDTELWHPLAKREVLDQKVGMLFRLAKSVFVDREDSVSRHLATKDLAKMIVNKHNVLIFPEGTYNRTDDNLKDFAGVSHLYLSQVLEAPIVTMALTKDYSKSPILRISEPYIVPRNMSILEAKEDSYSRLWDLVEKNKTLSRSLDSYKKEGDKHVN